MVYQNLGLTSRTIYVIISTVKRDKPERVEPLNEYRIKADVKNLIKSSQKLLKNFLTYSTRCGTISTVKNANQ